MKTFARKWLLPPGIYQLLADAPPSLKRVWSSKSESIELNPSGKKPATLDELRGAHYGEIVWVETEKIRLWGRALTPQQNQHVRYFENGVYSYRRFFELHQPQNQFEAIMLDATKVGGGAFFRLDFRRIENHGHLNTNFCGKALWMLRTVLRPTAQYRRRNCFGKRSAWTPSVTQLKNPVFGDSMVKTSFASGSCYLTIPNLARPIIGFALLAARTAQACSPILDGRRFQ